MIVTSRHPQRPPRVALLALAAAIATTLATAHPAMARTSRPDLVEVTVTVAQASVAPGGTIRVTDVATNHGRARAPRSSTTRYYLSRDAVWGSSDLAFPTSRTVPALARRGRSTGSVSLTLPRTTPYGGYWVLACADGGHRVAESNERNNCRAASRLLQVVGPNLTMASVASPPATINAGDAFPVAWTASNTGRATAGASVVRFYLSADTVRSAGDLLLTGTGAVAALVAGAMRSGSTTVTVPPTLTPGTWHLLACADDTAAVHETSEQDNCRSAAGTATVPSNATSATVTLDTARAVSKWTGGSGFLSLSVTDAAGNTYTLAMPNGSLLSGEQITMTPISSITGPVSEGLLAGVDLQPSGLILQKSATLTITPAAAIPVAEQIGFSHEGDGEQYHLYPLDTDTSSIVFHLDHFSGYELQNASAAEQANVAAHAPDNAQLQAESQTAQQTTATRDGQQTQQQFIDAMDAAFQARYSTVVQPRMQAATTDASLADDALFVGDAWVHNVQVLGLADAAPYTTQVSWILTTELTIVKNHFDNAYQHCIALDHPQAQYAAMSQDAHFLSVITNDASEPTAVLGADLAAKLQQCAGSYRFALHAHVTTTYNTSVSTFHVVSGDGDAVGVPINASTSEPLGGAFTGDGSGDMNVTNIATVPDPVYTCPYHLPTTAAGKVSVVSFVLDLNPTIGPPPDPDLPPKGRLYFAVSDSEPRIGCDNSSIPPDYPGVMQQPINAYSAQLSGNGGSIKVPTGTYHVDQAFPQGMYSLDITVSVTRN